MMMMMQHAVSPPIEFRTQRYDRIDSIFHQLLTDIPRRLLLAALGHGFEILLDTPQERESRGVDLTEREPDPFDFGGGVTVPVRADHLDAGVSTADDAGWGRGAIEATGLVEEDECCIV